MAGGIMQLEVKNCRALRLIDILQTNYTDRRRPFTVTRKARVTRIFLRVAPNMLWGHAHRYESQARRAVDALVGIGLRNVHAK